MKLHLITYFIIIFVLILLSTVEQRENPVQEFSTLAQINQKEIEQLESVKSEVLTKTLNTNTCTEDFKIGKHKFQFSGGMRFSSKRYGDGSISYATPVIAIDEDKVWIGGETNKNIVGAFELIFSESRNISKMPISKNKVPFKKVDLLPGWEQHKRLSGIDKVDERILVGLTEYYDAQGDAPFSHSVLNKEGTVDGWYKTNAVKIAHTSGWIQSMPDKWSKLLNSKYIMGHTENYPIAKRHSNGPSLYLWDGVIQPTMNVRPLLYYTLKNPLSKLRYNRNDVLINPSLSVVPPKNVAENNLWTVESQAWGGFILGDDYIVLGASGMHYSSGGYKIINKVGEKCGGPCAYDPKDYYNHYWVYNMNDIVKAKNPWDPKPYEWGKLNLGFAEEIIHGSNSSGLIKGVDFDGESLYLVLKNGDTSRMAKRLPLLLKYKICKY